MSLSSNLANMQTPHFYLELGQLISSTGHGQFAANMLELVNKLVSVSQLLLSEWTLDENLGCSREIALLGRAGLQEELPLPEPPRRHDPLLHKMLEMDDSLLIQINIQPHDRQSRNLPHQCHLVSRKANRRCVIAFYRESAQGAFSLAELSFLKSLSTTLLPLLERHAQQYRQQALKSLRNWSTRPVANQDQSPLQREFDERLSLGDITLSAREKEVCLGLLTGGTVPEMAQRLSVKNSSIETYLKRAAAKLGVSGRHGLAKWMVGA
ncbi:MULTISPECIES: helix-turn-helix transcriptional regulator [Pseudomonas]|uniref:Helix-turn-helix transcriptional regulator n=1 Tax=Pseudomonas sessilinigenes TaxID=658629 RepID=I0CEU5_9PSED|nr:MULTISPECIES: helix-turn-helix transcriptional regulator [Pseudomonas]AFH75327.1 LuxR family transcriptional regulator [Pseudomonas sessilinigenes]AZC23856.1 Transcriptional regulator, LuxR family [Pseudomonas sessilinigenes]QIH08994.1 helix-turn-helix transcriptional regulator [Pseudomonas sp. BIOMIG1BAC]QXH42836.1 helix-turn-helix transcriptional regulator [Pseudomonas sessilinigenes]UMZ14131.1 helix-turn-helix transcriptional regulator [Pseudomonas sp. MPFS]